MPPAVGSDPPGSLRRTWRQHRTIYYWVADDRVVELPALGRPLLADNAEQVATCGATDAGAVDARGLATGVVAAAVGGCCPMRLSRWLLGGLAAADVVGCLALAVAVALELAALVLRHRNACATLNGRGRSARHLPDQFSQRKAKSVKIELLYFDGCPSYEALLPDLRALLQREKVDERVELCQVESAEAAERERFLGSPTVRIDGTDIDPGAGEREDFGLKCRLYRTAEGTSGMPPEEWIVEALRRRGADS